MNRGIDVALSGELSDPRVAARLAAQLSPGTDLGPWEQAGLTWALTFFGPQPTEAEVLAVIDAGPG